MHVSEHHWSIHFPSMSSTSVSLHQSMMLPRTSKVAHSNANCQHLLTKLSMTKVIAYLLEVCNNFGHLCLWAASVHALKRHGVKCACMSAATIQVGSLSNKQPSFIFFLSLELIHRHLLTAYLIEVCSDFDHACLWASLVNSFPYYVFYISLPASKHDASTYKHNCAFQC